MYELGMKRKVDYINWKIYLWCSLTLCHSTVQNCMRIEFVGMIWKRYLIICGFLQWPGHFWSSAHLIWVHIIDEIGTSSNDTSSLLHVITLTWLFLKLWVNCLGGPCFEGKSEQRQEPGSWRKKNLRVRFCNFQHHLNSDYLEAWLSINICYIFTFMSQLYRGISRIGPTTL